MKTVNCPKCKSKIKEDNIDISHYVCDPSCGCEIENITMSCDDCDWEYENGYYGYSRTEDDKSMRLVEFMEDAREKL